LNLVLIPYNETILLPVTVEFYVKSHAAANFQYQKRDKQDKYFDLDIDETCQSGLPFRIIYTCKHQQNSMFDFV